MNESKLPWGEKRFHGLDYELQQKFGRKVAKLALDAGLTCPTRDGTKGCRGCIFCSSRGSGDFTKTGSITLQMKQQAEAALKKWKDCVFIAYFQSFSNTYAPVYTLRRLFDEALAYPDTCGLAVATRCDCISEEVLDLLTEYNEKTFLWVEMGLQTASDKVGNTIRRGFLTEDFKDAVLRLNRRNIRTVVHLIAGLPGEGREDFLKSVEYAVNLPIWGIKLQMLHVLLDSDLYKDYKENSFRLFEQDEYVELVCDALEVIRPDIVIHRLTGDGKKENLVAPVWSCNKRRVLTEINQELNRRRSVQGIYYLPVKY